MAEIEIRPAISTDIPDLMTIDNSGETTHVWQMETNSHESQIELQFRQIRLPRALKLPFPFSLDTMKDDWTKHTLFLVARFSGKPVGYLILDEENALKSAKITAIVVDRPLRRQGIGSGLVLSAQAWLKKRGITRFVMPLQAKNHSAIEFCRKLRFEFAGYADNYYANHDIALLFVNTFK